MFIFGNLKCTLFQEIENYANSLLRWNIFYYRIHSKFNYRVIRSWEQKYFFKLRNNFVLELVLEFRFVVSD